MKGTRCALQARAVCGPASLIQPKRHEGLPIEAKELAITAARIADEKRGEDILVLHVTEQLKVADYFVLITGANRPHARALCNELHVRLKALGERHLPLEGADLGWWVVLDYGDVVVHVMQPEAREYYDLERLYAECPRVEWQDAQALGTA